MVLLHRYGGHCSSRGGGRCGALPGTQGVAAAQGGLKSGLFHDLARIAIGALPAFNALVVKQGVEGGHRSGSRLGLGNALLAGLGDQPRHGARSGKAEDAHGHRTGHLRGIEPFHLAGGGQRFVHAAGSAVLHHLYHVVAALLAHTEH